MKDFTRRVKIMMYYQDKFDSLMNELNNRFTNETALKASQAKQTLFRQRAKVRRMIHENLSTTENQVK